MTQLGRAFLASPRQKTSRSQEAPHAPARRSLAPLAGAGVGLALLLVGYGFLALIPTVALAAGFMPAATALRRAMLCVPALVGAASCLLTVTALLQISLNARLVVAICLLALAGLRMALAKPPPSRWSSQADRWALVAPVLTFCAIYRPHATASTGERLALLSTTTDAGTHLGLIRSSLLEGGYITLLPNQGERLLGEAQGYPPGLAGNMGLVLQLLVGPDPSIPDLVSGTVPLLVSIYALLSWLATWTAIAMVETVVGRLNSSTAGLTACATAAAFVLGFNVLLWNTSAYAQILATACTIAGLAVLLKPHRRILPTSVFLALATVAGVHSWYLLAPVMTIAWMYYLSGRSRQRRPQNFCALLAAGAFCTFPVVNGPRATDQLNAAGGVGIPAGIGLMIFLLVTLWATWLLTTRCKSTRSPHLVVVALLVSLLILAIVVGAFQLIVTGAVQYYSVKVFYSAFVAGSIVIGAAAGVLWHRRAAATTAPHRRWVQTAALCLFLSPAVYGLTGVPSDVSRAVLNQTSVDQSKLLQAAVTSHPRGSPDDVDLWLGNDCKRGLDRIGSKALQDLALTWSADRERMFIDYVRRRPGVVEPFIKRATDAQTRRVEVYVRNPCHPAALAALDNISGVVVKRVP